MLVFEYWNDHGIDPVLDLTWVGLFLVQFLVVCVCLHLYVLPVALHLCELPIGILGDRDLSRLMLGGRAILRQVHLLPLKIDDLLLLESLVCQVSQVKWVLLLGALPC